MFYADKDLLALYKAIEEAPEIPGCTNDPELFFLEGSRFYHEKKAIAAVCTPCPVRQLCFEYGMKSAEFGTWGGVSASDRRKIREGKKLVPKGLKPVASKRVS